MVAVVADLARHHDCVATPRLEETIGTAPVPGDVVAVVTALARLDQPVAAHRLGGRRIRRVSVHRAVQGPIRAAARIGRWRGRIVTTPPSRDDEHERREKDAHHVIIPRVLVVSRRWHGRPPRRTIG
jgi:hypothetical protein